MVVQQSCYRNTDLLQVDKYDIAHLPPLVLLGSREGKYSVLKEVQTKQCEFKSPFKNILLDEHFYAGTIKYVCRRLDIQQRTEK